MPILFTSLPEHVQLSVAQKLEFRDFIKFEESSPQLNDVAKTVKTRISLETESVTMEYGHQRLFIRFFSTDNNVKRFYAEKFISKPIRIVAKRNNINTALTDAMCEALSAYLKATSTNLFNLHFNQEFACSLESFRLLLNSLKAEGLYAHHAIPPNFLLLPAIKSITRICFNCCLNDRELQMLNMPEMFLFYVNITSTGINAFLKQWLKGQRDIRDCQFTDMNQLTLDDVLEGIDYFFAPPEVCRIRQFTYVFIEKQNGHRLQITVSQKSVSAKSVSAKNTD